MDSVPIKKDANVSKESNDKLWNMLFHEENLFTSRLAVFLTAHGLLLTAMTITMRTDSARKTTLLFSAIGVILGVIWLLESARGARNISILCKALEYDTTFSEITRQFWAGWLGKVRRNRLAELLAGMAILGWGVLYLYTKFCMK
ncbi:MAG TPA: hypothetical protein VMW72_19045 [Sedimentisphaerales bacterium]|nr:hypothetical protein [Sedimentisphaerales bacterium]